MTAPIVRRVLRQSAVVALVTLVGLALCWWAYDWHLVEKMLTRMVMPTGLVAGLLVFGIVLTRAWGQTAGAWMFATVLMLYWLSSNTVTSNWLSAQLEHPYPSIDPATVEPFDAIIVLGGSTSSNDRGHVWLYKDGERVMLAARLFHQGKVDQLITTGRVYDWSPGVDMSVATHKIWTDLGIPPDRITLLDGQNTSLEMKQLKQHFAGTLPPRIGLLTSAFHLPRAERLARAQGLELIPIPAGFQSEVREPLAYGLIPNHHAIFHTGTACKEFLAAMVGR